MGVDLKPAAEISILSAGPGLPVALQHWQPRGLVITVNGAQAFFPGHVWVALDGFTFWRNFLGAPVCATAGQNLFSVPAGLRWMPLPVDRGSIGLSSTAALKLAGFDCIPGPDVSGHGDWQADALDLLRARTAEGIAALRDTGVEVRRVSADGRTVTAEA